MVIFLVILAVAFGLTLICVGLSELAKKYYDSFIVFVFCAVVMLFFIVIGIAGILHCARKERIKEAEKIEDWYYEEKLVEDKDSLSLWEYDFFIDYDKEKVYIKKYSR